MSSLDSAEHPQHLQRHLQAGDQRPQPKLQSPWSPALPQSHCHPLKPWLQDPACSFTPNATINPEGLTLTLLQAGEAKSPRVGRRSLHPSQGESQA